MIDVALTETAFGALLSGACEAIKQLNLVGVDESRVVIRKRPWDVKLKPPYCIVSPAPELLDEGSNDHSRYTYRIMVSLVQASNRDLVNGLGLDLRWRYDVTDCFHHRKDWLESIVLPDSGGLVDVIVEPGEPLIPEAFLQMYDAQYMVVNCRVWHRRAT